MSGRAMMRTQAVWCRSPCPHPSATDYCISTVFPCFSLIFPMFLQEGYGPSFITKQPEHQRDEINLPKLSVTKWKHPDPHQVYPVCLFLRVFLFCFFLCSPKQVPCSILPASPRELQLRSVLWAWRKGGGRLKKVAAASCCFKQNRSTFTKAPGLVA